jgi:hypothetical protein
LRPSTWQDIVGTLIANQRVCFWSSLGKPWRLMTTMLLALNNYDNASLARQSTILTRIFTV